MIRALLTLALAIACTAASACGTRDQVATALANEYGEHAIGRGLHANGSMVTLYVNVETGTWSVVSEHPRGRTCIVGSGHGWSDLDPEAPNTTEERL